MTDDLESIRERKREELQQQLREEAETNDDATADSATPADPVYVQGPDHLDELVEEHDVALADFYADWCGPCQMLEPVIGQIAAETDAAVLKIDVDAHQSLAAQYGVRGVPTLVLFSGGEVAEQLSGMQDQGTLKKLIERHG
jgi:thioredoxin 1